MSHRSTVVIVAASCFALAGCQTANMNSAGGPATPGCVVGTVGGAVIGGAAGSAIGSGTGQLWAVGAGATLGGATGAAIACR